MDFNSETRARDVRAACAYMGGELVDNICKREGMSKETLYRILRVNNIELRRNDVNNHFRNMIFDKVLLEKKKFHEVSAETGIPLDIIQGYAMEEIRRSQERESRRKKVTGGVSKPVNRTEVKEEVSQTRKEKALGKDGLIGLLPSSSNQGLNISQTLEERSKRESAESADDETKDDKLVGMFNDVWTEDEALKLSLLRELLRHAATVTTLPDYSKDGLLVPDLLLPVDIVIMKDITERSVSGEDVKSIAALHRTDVSLVVDLLNGGMSRDTFRDRFIKSLVNRGLIQL